MRSTNMTHLTAAACLVFLFSGCGGGAGDGHEAHSEDDGHNHGAEQNDAHAGEDEHEHGGETHDLGSVTAAGTTLFVTVGHVEAGAEVDVELERTGGDAPSGIRVWVGLESGVGSMKVKADFHDAHFHAHVEVPAELGSEARLWVQVESAGGDSDTQSLALPSETHDH